MRRGGRSDGRLDTYILTGEEEEEVEEEAEEEVEEEAAAEEEVVAEEEVEEEVVAEEEVEEEEGNPFKLRTDRPHGCWYAGLLKPSDHRHLQEPLLCSITDAVNDSH